MTTPAPAKSSARGIYLGQHLRGCDLSHRVLLPLEWRKKGQRDEFMMLASPVNAPDFLLVMPAERWPGFLLRVEAATNNEKESALMERILAACSFRARLDGFGRLPIPELAAKAAGITDQVWIIGRVEKYELWNPARWEAAMASPDVKRIADILDTVKT